VPGVSRVLFGTTDTKLLHVAMGCASPARCWTDDPNFTAQQASNPIPATPVYDGSFIYAGDSGGVLYAYPFSGTGTAWSTNFSNVTLFGAAASGATISAPIVLQNGMVLVTRSDGAVALASSAASAGLLKVGAGAAPAPVVDVRGSGGVAYIADGQGTLWAVQTPVPPVLAGQMTWPRPGRDSCNSRNALSSCQ
jgi:outer membrane protein assembly factor BamB